MFEHVRLRAEISNIFNAGVYVATCDQEIYEKVKGYGGRPIMTSKNHLNGTSRVSEAIQNIECDHVLVLQADEPLILPRHLKFFIEQISKNPHFDVWNAVAEISFHSDLEDHSIVKCAINSNSRILFCFRSSPFIAEFELQSSYVKKMLGLIAFKKNVISEINNLEADLIEANESIEQIRIINSDYEMSSINLGEAFSSVNLPTDVELVNKEMLSNQEQIEILNLYAK